MDLKRFIRDIPDFPKSGIMFRDISPLLSDPKAFASVIDAFAKEWEGKIDAIATLDARGFIFAGALAYRLKVPFSMVRKEGKLPAKTVSASYSLEYGKNCVELHADSFLAGSRVLVVDDVLATGGTALAARKLIQMIDSTVVGYAFVIELKELCGRKKILGCPIQSLVVY